MNIWLKGQPLALMNITTLFQICVTNAIHFILFLGWNGGELWRNLL